MKSYRVTIRNQRGWVGLIVLVLALVIVAVLAQTALKRYGLLGGFDSAQAPAKAGEASRLPSAVAPASIDATTAATLPSNAMERARGLESAVQQQAQEQRKQIDDAAK